MRLSLSSHTFLALLLSLFLFFLREKGFAVFPSEKPNALFIGPESYYMMRTREGGTKQEGALFGARIGYERLKRYRWYVGLDALFAQGKLAGYSGSGNRIKSELEDINLEVRLGYTLQHKYGHRPFLTPFFGAGYLRETNEFREPSPLLVTFRDTIEYVAAGVLSGIHVAKHWQVGVNIKLKWMVAGKSRVRDDPDFANLNLTMENELQYRIDAPISYQFCRGLNSFEFDIVPFYEYRHFGGRINSPFDFIDTQFQLWGARLEIAYRY